MSLDNSMTEKQPMTKTTDRNELIEGELKEVAGGYDIDDVPCPAYSLTHKELREVNGDARDYDNVPTLHELNDKDTLKVVDKKHQG
ncbi:hypothetical protein [Synechococcus sp. MIT S9509]|uniref:hypothetical protein n=1 Tax=Synechococcus sp. MIT S9509 TaxID=1801630 RepID=UPI0012E7EE51|nr:hypothetical protein [Synechococcus sp. MIT S9509]